MDSWNEFRKSHSGRGLSASELSELWKRYKEGDYDSDDDAPAADESDDEDLTAAVEAASEDPDEEQAPPVTHESPSGSGFGEWLRAWVFTDNSQLSNLLPSTRLLRQPGVNLALVLAGAFAFLLLLFNLFIGLANGCQVDPSAGCTVDWAPLLSNMLLQESVADSSPAPGEPDWFGSVMIFLSASLLWATMPANDS
ncbi:MAG: hypothetical protein MK233_04740 [Candidatus Poseidoniales archaeon]|nr:hypothetical protein [Candidatus Poseidoniales archaeon]